MSEAFDKWDRGEHTYDGCMENFENVSGGNRIGKALTWKNRDGHEVEATICPVNNGTCPSFMTIEIYGFHPHKGGKKTKLMICSIGVTSIDHCPLSK